MKFASGLILVFHLFFISLSDLYFFLKSDLPIKQKFDFNMINLFRQEYTIGLYFHVLLKLFLFPPLKNQNENLHILLKYPPNLYLNNQATITEKQYYRKPLIGIIQKI